MSKLIDLTGKRFGFWVVKSRGKNNACGQVQWLCVCECGNERNVTSNSLRSGNSTSCGCNHTPDLMGVKFGKLRVLNMVECLDKSRRYWKCQCKCGGKIIVSTYKLRQGIITSCGCNQVIIAGDCLIGDLFYNIAMILDGSEDILRANEQCCGLSMVANIEQNFYDIKQQMLEILEKL
jgi:hypothetical protein